MRVRAVLGVAVGLAYAAVQSGCSSHGLQQVAQVAQAPAGHGAVAGQSAAAGQGAAGRATGASGSTASQAGNGAAGNRVSNAAGASGAGGTSSEAAGAAGANAGGAGGLAADGGSGGTPALSTDDLVAAPDGKDSGAGTMDDPLSLSAALTRVAPGHTIYLRGGTYSSNAQITIEAGNDGSDGQRKTLAALMGEKPVLDFSSEPYGKDSNPRGLQINASYWHVIGLTVQNAADNGIYLAGDHDIIENCVVHGNRDTGLQIGRASSSQTQMSDWPSDNLILNCESYDNYDAPPGAGENADGFAAKLTVGPGNVFRGCVSHNNIDDGWDLYTKSDTGPIAPVTIDQCISHHNGTLTDGTTNKNGDRNGFKLGGEKIAVAHVVTRSVAYANGATGFTWNSNPGAIRLSNTLAFDNASANYKFGDNSTTTQAVFTNNVSFWTTDSGAQSDKAIGMDASSSNCFWTSSGSQHSQNGKGLMVSASDFKTPLDPTASVMRAADGTPDFSAFALASGSDLINAGVVPDGTLPFDSGSYYHAAPDLGAVESP